MPWKDKEMRVAITGHQPHLLGGHSADVSNRLTALARDWMARHRPAKVVSGMAAARAAVAEGIPLVAALAWPEQGRGWPADALAELDRLLGAASLVHVAHPARTPGMWAARDRWVLDRGETVLALWSGAPGGTADAVAHAGRLGRPVDNLWSEWTRVAA